MSYRFLDIAVTPSVRAVQAKMGADGIWQDFKGHREFDRSARCTTAWLSLNPKTPSYALALPSARATGRRVRFSPEQRVSMWITPPPRYATLRRCPHAHSYNIRKRKY